MNKKKYYYSHDEFLRDVAKLESYINTCKGECITSIYPVRCGGNVLAHVLSERLKIPVVNEVRDHCLVVDDICSSGKTLSVIMDCAKLRYKYIKTLVIHQDYDSSFVADFSVKAISGVWIDYFWEKPDAGNITDHVTRILQFIGENPNREGLLDTPARVVKSWSQLYSGYKEDAGDHLSKCFSSDMDELIICKDIEFYSNCEHHMQPFFGKVHVGYLPGGKVVGLSKIARAVEVFARRLQIQEQLTEQIAKSMMDNIEGIKGCGVVVEAKHFCMCARGVNKQNSSMVTSSLKGVFKEDSELKAEFMKLAVR